MNAFVGIALALTVTSCAGSRPRDSVTGDEVEQRGDQKGSGGYEHVARRAHATVALAEARGLDPTEAKAATEQVADRLEECAKSLPPSGGGVVRVVARIGDDGAVDGLNVRVEPGHAPTALRCVIAPVKLLVFGPAPGAQASRPDGTAARGLALEAQWTP